ncbi:NUDIX hydrolase N-terminal domain-containing protein [Candidatus Enterococcus ferrettii]|uniref:Nudix hydrolase domain-containing protein n=1 Tax=Candidatus Enterococcus ferrettii TaxID=2815324 RepID=A0ABV0ERN4_9ENTE|nr:NUDIX hydrolase [Enterococcus sp. 665A]MBO1342851.1 NUDIX hydrolase [Enterococcus sp. 665A]
MNINDRLTDWAVELQAIAQAGLTYTKDPFDAERFERIRSLSVEMLAVQSPLPELEIRKLFAEEPGYPTPKLDTRAAIFKNDRILLVQENNGKWSLPGGWVDINQSLGDNVLKEVKEETGFEAETLRVIALQDRNRHNPPRYAYGVCKVFILCQKLSGQFEQNIETLQIDWFSLSDLPELAEEKTTKEQITLCFEANADPNWQVVFD